MKVAAFVCSGLLIVAALGSISAVGQSNNIPQIQHAIIVIQENRTPTSIFHEDANLIAEGAHVQPVNNQGPCDLQPGAEITLTGVPLAMCAEIGHFHPDWLSMYHGGMMDGACQETQSNQNCTTCPTYQNNQYCPYTYTLNTNGILAPYFNLAENYGFANWMFSTQQGPSTDGHLFLFAGTSAPDFYGDTQGQAGCLLQNNSNCWEWFASENDYGFGCVSPANATIKEIAPDGTETFSGYQPVGRAEGYPCFYHNSLPTLLDAAGVTWRYYTASGMPIWNSPDLLGPICQPASPPGGTGGPTCQGADYTNNVVQNPTQILTDLGADESNPGCNLRNVSWVIPDGSWSDHPGDGSVDAGPSWVAAIVNALGGYDNGGHHLPHPCSYWQNTVVVVTWDDWGGFYDDVPPPYTQFPNNTGGQFVYGFRVPLVVISAYTPPNYVSGPCNKQTHDCTNAEKPQYIHDFGSILNFIEYVFGQGGNFLGYPTFQKGIGDPSYPYADWFAPDGPNRPECNPVTCPYGLSDFFNFPLYGNNPRPFSSVSGAQYQTDCFFNATTCIGFPSDPDNDAID